MENVASPGSACFCAILRIYICSVCFLKLFLFFAAAAADTAVNVDFKLDLMGSFYCSVLLFSLILLVLYLYF